MIEIRHIPVLLQETMDGLQMKAGGVVVDGTLGSGGHSLALLERILPHGKVIALDTDSKALVRVMQRIDALEWAKNAKEKGNIVFFHKNFSEISEVVELSGESLVQGILVDLGFSSDQMDTPERGLSFLAEGPLDMRLNQEGVLTAERVVNEYAKEDLIRILKEYGEEIYAVKIVAALMRERLKERILTTTVLTEIITKAVPRQALSKKIHPATKTFQALRIEVNQEMEHLRKFLPQAIDRLAKGGRLAVIAFHSGEDVIVKRVFRENARGCICPKDFPLCRCDHQARVKLITKKPIVPSDEEVKDNPRSRSAKLRIIEKI
jgi:16S rRNA (cytosine1402-N4)-methyltransferase